MNVNKLVGIKFIGTRVIESFDSITRTTFFLLDNELRVGITS